MKRKIISAVLAALILVMSVPFGAAFASPRAAAEGTPEPEIHAVSASVLSNGRLQVTVNAGDGALTFRLYTKSGDGEWELLTSSEYPVLFAESYDPALRYAVSAGGGEKWTELVEVTKFSTGTAEEYNAANILEGKSFVPTSAALSWVHSANYGYDKLTDGIFYKTAEGRFSTKVSASANFDATVELGGEFLISDIKIWDFTDWQKNALTNCEYVGSSLKIEVLRGGVPTVVFEGTNADILTHRVGEKDAVRGWSLSFFAGLIKGDAIRISAPSPVPDMSISIHEITVSGVKLPTSERGEWDECDNLFSGLTFTAGTRATPLASAGGYKALTDGVYAPMQNGSELSGHFDLRCQTNGENGVIDACLDFGETVRLDTLRLYDVWTFAKIAFYAGQDITVRVCRDGEWSDAMSVTLTSGDDGNIYSTYRRPLHGVSRDPVKNQWLEFSLGGVTAEKIEIICERPVETQTGYYEFECSGARFRETGNAGEAVNIFEGKQFTHGPLATKIQGGTSDYFVLTDGVFSKMQSNSSGTGYDEVGDFSRRCQTNGSGAGNDSAIDAVMDLGRAAYIKELRLYDVGTWGAVAAYAGKYITVRVFNYGEWSEAMSVELTSGADGNVKNEYRQPKGTRDPEKNQWLSFSLGGVRAERIEIICRESVTAGNAIAFYEFEAYGYFDNTESERNILSGRSVTSTAAASGENTLANITDGNLTTRFEPAGELKNGYSVEADLGSARPLYTLRVYDYRASDDLVGGVAATRSNKTYVEVLTTSGEWVRVADSVSLTTEFSSTVFYLYGIVATKIRVGFMNTQTFDNGKTPQASIYEISCTSSAGDADKSGMVNALASVPELENGVDALRVAAHKAAMKRFRSYLMEEGIGEITAGVYEKEIRNYAASLDVHAWRWSVTKAPTCSTKGTEHGVCTACGAERDREVIYAADGSYLVSSRLPDGYFNGKKIVTIGDSITFGYNALKGYGLYLENLLGANVTNLGISGTVLCEGGYRTTNRTFAETNIAGADVVTILLGANDWDACRVEDAAKGIYTLGEPGETSTTTYRGSVRAYCEKINELKKTEQFRNTTFIFMTPLPTSWYNVHALGTAENWDQDKLNNTGHTLREFCVALIEECAAAGVPVIDLNLYSGFYYNSPEDNNVVELIADGIHPTTAGQEFLSHAVADGIMNNYHYESRGADCSHDYRVNVTAPSGSDAGSNEYICRNCHYRYVGEYDPFADIVTLDRVSADNLLRHTVLVPADGRVSGISLDGRALDLSTLPTVSEGGVTYYAVISEVLPSAPLGERCVSLRLVSGGTERSREIKFSLAGDYNDVVTLQAVSAEKIAHMKDALLYVRAAMDFFGTATDESTKAINDIIGADYGKDLTPESVGLPAATKRDSGKAVTGVSLNIVGVPTLVFYVSSDNAAVAESFRVTADGKEVKTCRTAVGDSGARIEAEFSLSDLAKTVSFTYTGADGTVQSGEYNLAAYLASDAASADVNLYALAIAAGKYAKSLSLERK